MNVSKSQRWVWTLVFLSFFLVLLFVVWPLLAQAQTQERVCYLESKHTMTQHTDLVVIDECSIDGPVQMRLVVTVEQGRIQMQANESGHRCQNNLMRAGEVYECRFDVFDGELDEILIYPDNNTRYTYHLFAQPVVEPNQPFLITLPSGGQVELRSVVTAADVPLFLVQLTTTALIAVLGVIMLVRKGG